MKLTIAIFALSATAATAGSLSDPIVESVRPVARVECVDRGWIRITGTNACMYVGSRGEAQGQEPGWGPEPQEDRSQSRPERPDRPDRPDRPEPETEPDPQDEPEQEPEREPEQEPEREECR